MLLSRCSVLQSKQDAAVWCWQNNQREEAGKVFRGYPRLSRSPPSSPLEITWQLFLLTCAPWERRQWEQTREQSRRDQISLAEQHKTSMGNKKRSAFITAHTDKDKKDYLIFDIHLSYRIKNNIHVSISVGARKKSESCFYYAESFTMGTLHWRVSCY